MDTGAWIAVAALLLALGFGLYRAATDGRFRGTHRVRGADERPVEAAEPEQSVLADTRWADGLGERATLLQFSSAFCAPCRATRRVLADVAAARPGVVHVEVDAEHHLDFVRRLGIMRTPTTLVLDHLGQELGRATGLPSREQVLRVLGDG